MESAIDGVKVNHFLASMWYLVGQLLGHNSSHREHERYLLAESTTYWPKGGAARAAYWPFKGHKGKTQCVLHVSQKMSTDKFAKTPRVRRTVFPNEDLAKFGRDIFSFWTTSCSCFWEGFGPLSSLGLALTFLETPAPASPQDELSDPNLTPLPTLPDIKYVPRSPCCDKELQATCCYWKSLDP